MSEVIAGPQCQFFVVRKKRLCRMTVRPGRQYCGEHEPDPITDHSGQSDARIPCPNDPKHTCYASKLEKHLSICNARQGEVPEYIVHNINAPTIAEVCPRKPLSDIPKHEVLQLLDKIDLLYEKHVKDTITTAPERPIHKTVEEEFKESDRTESSRRHLRQASSLLWLVEDEGLVRSGTCYVELGAGRGQLAYYAERAWCAGGAGGVLAVDRASPRHKRDNLAPLARRLRADLAHLALHRAPDVQRSRAVVGIAKHLCGAATDYALRCMTAREMVPKSSGIVLATCCHHRCELASYVGTPHLQELGVSAEELNIMLGMVSWATCGDGRSRDRRRDDETLDISRETEPTPHSAQEDFEPNGSEHRVLSQAERERAGKRAKRLLDWGRLQYLTALGLSGRLSTYVPSHVSPENICIVVSKSI